MTTPVQSNQGTEILFYQPERGKLNGRWVSNPLDSRGPTAKVALHNLEPLKVSKMPLIRSDSELTCQTPPQVSQRSSSCESEILSPERSDVYPVFAIRQHSEIALNEQNTHQDMLLSEQVRTPFGTQLPPIFEEVASQPLSESTTQSPESSPVTINEGHERSYDNCDRSCACVIL